MGEDPAVTASPSLAPLVVPGTFHGPPGSGNGGWAAGALAQRVAGAGGAVGTTVEVTLRQPPPLDTDLPVVGHGEGLAALDADGRPVLEGRLVDRSPGAGPPVDVGTARAAEAAYAGLGEHPFPGCFVCGTARGPDDGLRVFPGAVPGLEGVVAAAWTPRATTCPEQWRAPVTWAALDCAGAWASDLSGRMMVLGRMTARLERLPRVGAEHVVVGEALGAEGRRHRARTTLRDAAGRLVGSAEQVWVEVDPATFGLGR